MSELLEIPLDSTEPNFTQDVDLSGVTYRLRFTWNVRGQYWVVTLLDTNDNIIVSGQKLVTNFPLFYRIVSNDMPRGLLFCVDTAGNGITRDNLGTDITLCYQGVT